MSRINDLINQYCPDGVAFEELATIFDTKNGYTPAKSKSEYWTNGTVPWFRMEDIRDHGHVLNDSIQHINQSAVKGGRLFPENSILIATSATIGEHALITVPHLSNQRFTSLALKSEFSDKFDIKFIYYYCYVLDEWCKRNTTLSSFASVDMAGFKRFKFPVPPLPVQEEIVRILDTFTQLEAELEAELEARKQQYTHYLRSLAAGELLNSKNTTYIKLGDLGIRNKGTQITASKMKELSKTPGPVRIFAGGKTVADVAEDSIPYKNIIRKPSIIVKSRGNIGFDFYDKPFSHKSELWSYSIEYPNVNQKYVYYFLLTQVARLQRLAQATSVKIPQLSVSDTDSLLVPILPIEEQNRIVEILDNFDALTTSLQEGLPAEIEARRQQYEYYRDQLLSFPEKKDEEAA